MQVILLEKIANLGDLGEVVKVRDGYARNYLIPTGTARRATDAAIKEFEAKRAELVKAAAAKLSTAQAQGEKLSGQSVSITQKAGVDGRLFGSVTPADVASAIKASGGPEVDKRRIELGSPIKTLGSHETSVRLHPEVAAKVNIEVVAA